ncbi:MAG TPA: pantetheine-phosphate adenylyltransferase [Pyrinomonadaceae bacterium]|nr:pantetheine-phosphate adenylyltransferase [Pyrinomonadaceae bacterium]
MIRRAIYPGSFDPMTNGHLDIIERASQLFDEIVIGVLSNPDKVSMFTIEERKKMIAEILPKTENCNLIVEDFSGLLVDYARKREIFAVIRGIRAVSDYEYELQMALMNRHLEPQLETVFLVANPNVSYISSSLIKQIYKLGGKIDGLVPKLIAEKMR